MGVDCGDGVAVGGGGVGGDVVEGGLGKWGGVEAGAGVAAKFLTIKVIAGQWGDQVSVVDWLPDQVDCVGGGGSAGVPGGEEAGGWWWWVNC